MLGGWGGGGCEDEVAGGKQGLVGARRGELLGAVAATHAANATIHTPKPTRPSAHLTSVGATPQEPKTCFLTLALRYLRSELYAMQPVMGVARLSLLAAYTPVHCTCVLVAPQRLPKYTRRVVDLRQPLQVIWYEVGTTPASAAGAMQLWKIFLILLGYTPFTSACADSSATTSSLAPSSASFTVANFTGNT